MDSLQKQWWLIWAFAVVADRLLNSTTRERERERGGRVNMIFMEVDLGLIFLGVCFSCLWIERDQYHILILFLFCFVFFVFFFLG